MKNSILLIIILFIISIFSFAQYVNAESWKKEVAPQDTIRGNQFEEIYSTEYCSVTKLRDESGVNLRARGFVNNDSTSLIYHQVQIRYDAGKFSSDHFWIDINEHGVGWERATGPDLFAEKCARIAKLLPLQVKKQFFGYYSIK